jgi:hypothetical protein
MRAVKGQSERGSVENKRGPTRRLALTVLDGLSWPFMPAELCSVLPQQLLPESRIWYVQTYGLDGSKKRRFFAVLHHGPVDSAEIAVRAAIVGEFRKQRG